MRVLVFAVLLAAAPLTAEAQDHKLTWIAAPEMVSSLGEELFSISSIGEVDIRWEEVDRTAAAPTHDLAWQVAMALRCAREVISCRGIAGK